MDEWRLDRLVERVVAWHNRHPLARRIGAADVHATGYVALPFEAPAGVTPAGDEPLASPAGGASLRDLARARQAAAKVPVPVPASPPPPADEAAGTASPPPAPALPAASFDPRKPPRLLFAGELIDAVSLRRLVRWAARHARSTPPPPAGRGPMRRVDADASLRTPGLGVELRYTMTAAIEVDGQRTRVLVAAGSGGPVLGRRLTSRPRVAAIASVLVGIAAWFVLPAIRPLKADAVVQASAGPHAAVAPAAVAPPPPQLVVQAPDAASPAAATRTAETPASSVPAVPAVPAFVLPPVTRTAVAPPPDVEPRLGRITLPPLVPPLGDEARAAARRTRSDDRAAVPSTGADPGRRSDHPAPTTAAAMPTGPVWALSSRLLRTRAESRQVAQAIAELLREHGDTGVRVELHAVGDDWRVVGWPFTARAAADRARAMLVARGLPFEVVDF